jgi:hypothetical protein
MSGRLRRKGLGNVLAACGVAAALAALPTASAAARAPAAGGAIHGPTVARSLTTSTYWTAARLRQAKSLDVAVTPSQARALRAVPTAKKGLPGRMPPHAVGTKLLTKAAGGGPGFGSTAAPWYGSASSAPATTSGRVFFTGNDGLGYSCSGSTVNSAGKNLVFTAGHCVHPGGTGTWHANWVFIPGYNNGYAPYGTWSARQLWSWNLWTQNGDRAYDIGVAVMNTDGWARHIVNVVGGQGIEWNYPQSRYVFQYGYPARSPFNGGTLQYCSGWTYNDWGNQGINCTMTEGASGGPWLDNFNGSLGWLDSVNSWVFWDGNGFRYKWNGPYFGNDARDLFNITGSL